MDNRTKYMEYIREKLKPLGGRPLVLRAQWLDASFHMQADSKDALDRCRPHLTDSVGFFCGIQTHYITISQSTSGKEGNACIISIPLAGIVSLHALEASQHSEEAQKMADDYGESIAKARKILNSGGKMHLRLKRLEELFAE